MGTLDGDKCPNRHAHAWHLRPTAEPRPSPLPTFKVPQLPALKHVACCGMLWHRLKPRLCLIYLGISWYILGISWYILFFLSLFLTCSVIFQSTIVCQEDRRNGAGNPETENSPCRRAGAKVVICTYFCTISDYLRMTGEAIEIGELWELHSAHFCS